jgi:ATP-dependent RNA helicase RhlE
MSFDTLGLKETLLQAVAESGYTIPTAIQLQAIPAILAGKDVMAAAQTGTGKTAGFTLPLLQMLGGKPPVPGNHARVLILTPTRELAAQIQESIQTYGKHEKLRSVVVFGGVNINPQMLALRKGCDILVATPGRLLDLYQQNAVKFGAIEVLVLDEADRMLDMGFIRDIRKILGFLPKQRQNLMFSATFSDDIRTLAKTICNKPVEIDVAPRNSTVATITQHMYQVGKEHKLPLLGKLLKETSEQVLVFSRTKHGANNLVKKLAQYSVDALAIHGNKSQPQRTKALADFKSNKVQVLVATDIAARGIDIDQLAMVINFDMPQVAEDYVHRIGRTGRAGASGVAISLVGDDETGQLRAIERLIKRKIERLEFDRDSLPARVAGSVEISDDRPPRRPQGRSQQGRSGQNQQQARAPQGQRNGQHQPSRSQSQPRTPGRREVQPPLRSPSADARAQGLALTNGTSSAAGSGRRNPQRSGGGNSGRPQRSGRRSSSQGEVNGNSMSRDANSHSQHSAASMQQTKPAGFWKKLRDSLPGTTS